MIVDIPDNLIQKFSNIQWLTEQIEGLLKSNTNNLPLNRFIPKLVEERNKLRIDMSKTLENSVLKAKEKNK